MGLFSSKPKIKVQTTKKDGFSGWLKCTHCTELIHVNELKDNLHCCPKCNYHYRLTAAQRVELLADPGTFKELFQEYKPTDPLGFVDSEKYTDRLDRAKKKTNRDEAVMAGLCSIEKRTIALGVLDFSFMGGSMGSVVGERLTLLIEMAIREHLPLLIVSASGGARMQESILSLMQMAKTSAAIAKYQETCLPYISLLTNPTTGGVTASFATLGDIIIAEPDALIGFAGPRVVEQTTREKLPPGAQKSEFLLEKGMIDCIVNRHQLKDKLSLFLDFLTGNARGGKKAQEALPKKLQEILDSVEQTEEEEPASAKK
ncbi:MAG: Acetyl-coenzyme A carboxylase carboxyl transferase subunit beta [Chlamydiae bacterium]|nr:Acetyl-coenzyme A carboxylase carboxyl transferase subunit beta [Chlamydiota bacterium]